MFKLLFVIFEIYLRFTEHKLNYSIFETEIQLFKHDQTFRDKTLHFAVKSFDQHNCAEYFQLVYKHTYV